MATLMRRFRRNAEDRAPTRQCVPAWYPATTLGAPTVAGPVSEADALRLADVWACVKVIVETASMIPLVPYRRAGDGRERLVGGRLVELLRKPAPGMIQSA